MDLPSHPDVSRPIERLKQIGHDVYGPETVQERFQAAKREDEAAGVDRRRACALKTAQRIVDGGGFRSLG